jgi:hypothetical protein
MKITYPLVFCLLLNSGFCFGQFQASVSPPDPETISIPPSQKVDYDDYYPRNNIKVNLTSLYMKNYSIAFERSLTRKISVQLAYRHEPYSTVWKKDRIKELATSALDLDDETIADIDDTKYISNAVTAEMRFYTSKKDGARGFYISLYGRYSSYDMNLPIFRFYADNGIYYNMPVEAAVNGLGGGILFGSQWWIAKRVSIDLSILGGHYGRLGGKLEISEDLSEFTDNDRNQVRAELDDKYMIGDKTILKNIQVTSQGIEAKVKGPFLGARLMALHIGFLF